MINALMSFKFLYFGSWRKSRLNIIIIIPLNVEAQVFQRDAKAVAIPVIEAQNVHTAKAHKLGKTYNLLLATWKILH